MWRSSLASFSSLERRAAAREQGPAQHFQIEQVVHLLLAAIDGSCWRESKAQRVKPITKRAKLSL
jgi:hypothetical protein